ncbi:MAG: GIY-YIG nuclease family protein [Candidatus Cloacimonetes bacterium]|nr:GIY-YIG nuclease family protein [Candidatus Cloacimonadota bacterium]
MEIYKIENLVNGKCYIGQTVLTFNERYNFKGEGIERVLAYLEMREDKTSSYSDKLYHNNHLLNAIRKYGTENFTVEIIDTAESIEELNKKEKYWIKHYNAFRKGYNKCKGGDGIEGWEPSNATRKFWSKQRKGRHAGKRNPNYGGKLFTKETLEKMSIAKKGKYTGEKSWVARPVINLDTMEVFDAMAQACRKYNISSGNLTACCQRKERGKHGVRKLAGGYRWMYYDEYLKKGDIVGEPINKRHKAVVNIDTGEVFETAAEAGRQYSIDSSTIGKVCRGEKKTCGGHRWRYKEQE